MPEPTWYPRGGMSVLDGVELAFVTGKGGVGKSTVALATALAAARDGRRVVLCEVAGQARAAGAYGVEAPGPGREVQLEEGLWSTTIDPVVALEEWAGRQIGSRRLVGLLTHSNAFAAFVNAAPGARELVAITKAWELGRGERWVKGRAGYDLVVLDGPASGHGVGLLRTPHTFAEIARVGPIATQARKVVALLEDPQRTALVAVGRPLDAVVVNGVVPRRFSAADVDRLLSRDGEVPGPVAAAARRQHGQATTQQSQVRRLR